MCSPTDTCIIFYHYWQKNKEESPLPDKYVEIRVKWLILFSEKNFTQTCFLIKHRKFILCVMVACIFFSKQNIFFPIAFSAK